MTEAPHAAGRDAEARAAAVAPVPRLARRAEPEPGVHHLPDRQAVPGRPAAERPPLDLRAQLQSRHGPVREPADPLPLDAVPAVALRQCARAGPGVSGPRSPLRAAGRLDHGRSRHPRRRRGRQGADRLRQHAVRLPRRAERGRELRAAVAAAVHQPPRGRGPLPSERAGAERRARRVRHGGQPLGRRRRLARPADRGRRAGRRGGGRGGAGGPLDAALAALARRGDGGGCGCSIPAPAGSAMPTSSAGGSSR